MENESPAERGVFCSALGGAGVYHESTVCPTLVTTFRRAERWWHAA